MRECRNLLLNSGDYAYRDIPKQIHSVKEIIRIPVVLLLA
jgi:hypothetical protein